MLLRIKGLIPSDKLAIVREILDSAHFVDGKLSAGKEAVNVKKSRQCKKQRRTAAEPP